MVRTPSDFNLQFHREAFVFSTVCALASVPIRESSRLEFLLVRTRFSRRPWQISAPPAVREASVGQCRDLSALEQSTSGWLVNVLALRFAEQMKRLWRKQTWNLPNLHQLVVCGEHAIFK